MNYWRLLAAIALTFCEKDFPNFCGSIYFEFFLNAVSKIFAIDLLQVSGKRLPSDFSNSTIADFF